MNMKKMDEIRVSEKKIKKTVTPNLNLAIRLSLPNSGFLERTRLTNVVVKCSGLSYKYSLFINGFV